MNIRGLRKAADEFSLLLQALTNPKEKAKIIAEITQRIEQLQEVEDRTAKEAQEIKAEREAFLAWREGQLREAQAQADVIVKSAHKQADKQVSARLEQATRDAKSITKEAEELRDSVDQEADKISREKEALAKEREELKAVEAQFLGMKRDFLAKIA